MCGDRGIRAAAEICSCNVDENTTDNYACRMCSEGCLDCEITDEGLPRCLACAPNYIVFDDMPHLCGFVPEFYEEYDYLKVPMGYEIPYEENLEDLVLKTMDEFAVLFYFNLSDDRDTLELGYEGEIYTEDMFAWWTVQLLPDYSRHDSINRVNRGWWFDGKYDYLQMAGVLPPRFGCYFWTKPYHDGTLLSTSAVYDEPNQHLVNMGIRGKRLESSVEYGDDYYHPAKFNKRTSHGENSGFVPEGSVHANSSYIPMKRYSKTDMDVINMKEWAEVGYVFDYSYHEDLYSFKYSVNGEVVDTSFYAGLTHIFYASYIYPTKILLGAQEVDDHMSNMFRGFIYTVEGTNGREREYPFFELELDNCEWNEFLNWDDKCERCPYWCPDGCDWDGSCRTPEVPNWLDNDSFR